MTRAPEAYVTSSLFQHGMGTVAVCRFKAGGRVEVGAFLVDTYCLGVKDATLIVHDAASLEAHLLPDIFHGAPYSSCPASYARKLVEDAAAYARSLGFAPTSDYKKGARVFGGIDPKECDEVFEFGRGGKPYYIAGPNDGQKRIERIVNVLRAKCGDDGFDFTVPAESPVGMDATEAGDGAAERWLGWLSDSFDSGAPDLDPAAEQFANDTIHSDDLLYRVNQDARGPESRAGLMLRLALDLSGAGEEALDDRVRLVCTLWNAAVLPDDDRAQLMAGMPESLKELMTLAIEGGKRSLQTMARESGFVISHWKLLTPPESGISTPRLLLITVGD